MQDDEASGRSKKETWSIGVFKGPSGALSWNGFFADIAPPKSLKDRLLMEIRRSKRPKNPIRCKICKGLHFGTPCEDSKNG